jgi:3-oxoacyl-[acyl-carrier protein] reductase
MIKRTILITGASKGIGRALANHVAAEGHEVVGIARHPDSGFPGELLHLDLSEAEATQAAHDPSLMIAASIAASVHGAK